LSIGLVGKKSGMSRLFQEDGTSVPVTVISVAANFVADIKTHEKHGYSAVVVSKNTSKNLTKSSSEFFKKHNLSNGELFEFRTESADDLKVGHHLTAEIFEVGKMVDVTGTSKVKVMQELLNDIILRCKMLLTEIHWLTELTDQLANVKLLVESGKVKKCQDIWAMKQRPFKV
jgi:hypothetical protein